MSFRPKGWDKTKDEYLANDKPNSSGIYNDDFTAGFEAGADAMLKALRQQGATFGEHHTKGVVRYLASHNPGTFLFIPDEDVS